MIRWQLIGRTEVCKCHIGGYQPLQKWLKDRKGRELSAEDVSHYRRMVRAIARTRDIMAKIDAAYEVTVCTCED